MQPLWHFLRLSRVARTFKLISMKKYIFLLAILALVWNVAICQTTDKISSEYTADEKLLDATIICLDAVEAPTKYNEFAKQYINKPAFPKASSSVSHDELQKNISDWLETQPKLIENILTERKKAHDKLYGARPY